MYTIFRGGNIGDGEYFYKGDDLQISEQFVKDNTILRKNCYITPAVTSIEHIGKIAFIDNDLNKTVAGGFVLIVYPIFENIDLLKYYLYVLSSKYHKDNCKKITNKSGQAFYNLSREKLMQQILPLPPIEEQKRIAEKIKHFLPFISNYNKINDKLDTLNSNYKEDLKKSILQYAIQGKLVKQNPNDESAEVLINKILEKKRELIKTKQIKKENLSVIYKDSTDNQFYEKFDDGKVVNVTDEIPFEIPDSWRWLRLRNIVYNHGQKKPSIKFSYIDIGSIDNKNHKLSENENIILPQNAPSRARKIIKEGDIIYSTVRPYLHNMCIIDKSFSCEPIASTGFAVMHCIEGINNMFLFYYLLSPIFDTYANSNENAKGVAYPAINDERLYKAIIPIPSSNEQSNIVDKIEELFNVL